MSKLEKETNWISGKKSEHLLFFVFILLTGLIRFQYHEMWKDEWQAWLVARDLSYREMFSFLYYEGHPALWYIYLKCWTFIPLDDVFALQFSHFIIVAGIAFLICYRSEIPLFWRVGILFSYFFAFEYGVISRGYALVIFLFLLIVMRQDYWKKKPLLFAVLLILLTQTEVYGIIGAGMTLLYLFIHRAYWKNPGLSLKDRQVLYGAFALLIGVIIFWYSMSWAPDATDVRVRLKTLMDSFEGKSGLTNAFQGIWANAMMPGVFRDANTYGPYIWGLMAAVGSILMLLWMFIKDKAAMISLIFAGLSVMYFASQIYSGGLRQWGMFYVMFIGLLHLSYEHSKSPILPELNFKDIKLTGKVHLIKLTFLLIISISQVRYGFLALYKDFKNPFSHASAAGAFISDHVAPETPIVGISPFNTAAAAAYADRTIYALPDGEPFTYFRWLDPVYIAPMDELILFKNYKRSEDLLVLTHKMLDLQRYPALELWQKFDSYSIKGENYYLYRIRN